MHHSLDGENMMRSIAAMQTVCVIIHNICIVDNEEDELAGDNDWQRDMVEETMMAGNDGSNVGTADNSTVNNAPTDGENAGYARQERLVCYFEELDWIM
ncbi:hypothetical protein HDU78_011366 [Chytriomyces hyalinus]|nr:hypothetical protein HDU78_011366 [Chytriomyces hyalinus]